MLSAPQPRGSLSARAFFGEFPAKIARGIFGSAVSPKNYFRGKIGGFEMQDVIISAERWGFSPLNMISIYCFMRKIGSLT